MKHLWKVLLICALAMAALAQDGGQQAAPAGPGQGQQQGPERRLQGYRRFGRGGVMGEITAVNPDGFTLKTMQGNAATVKVSDQTKFVREQQAIKKTDLKVGDTIRVQGAPDTSDPTTWNANLVIDNTAQVKAMKEAMGKTVIAGEVKSIEDTKLTILRPDGETQTIQADENTSFQKGRDKVTLADIKAGDHVFGRGAVKDGVFVPSELHVGGFGAGAGPRDEGQQGGAPGAPPAPRPKSQPQQ